MTNEEFFRSVCCSDADSETRGKAFDMHTNAIEKDGNVEIAEVPMTARCGFQVLMHLIKGEKIRAIKKVREETGLGLKESKNIVDSLLPINVPRP